jgi:cytochrome c-type biogenesis protein CcmH/NrfG
LPEALAEVEKARGVLESGDGDEDLGRRVRQWLTDIKTVERFEELRRQHPDITDWDRVDAGYLRVFREYGIDPDALSVEEAAARVAKSQIMFELTVALDTWAWRLQIAPVDRNPPRWHRLRKIQRTADPDPFRQRLHRAADRPGPNALPELRAMAAEADVARLQPRTLALLGGKLVECGDPEAGVAFLRIAQRQHPGNFLLNDVLGSRLTQLKSPPWNEVIEYRRVALALHPNSASAHSALGTALQQAGRVAEAHEALREAVRLAPDDVYQHERLGWVLLSQKKFSETEAAFREVIRLKPDRAAGHHGLGRALLGQSKFSEGIASLREAVRLGSKDHWVYDALGWALVRQGEFAEAEAAFREFVRRKPELVHGYFGLGRALVEQEKFADAEAALREALRIAPTRPEVPDLLARARAGQGKGSEAERLKKLQLGKVLREQKS